MILEEIKQFQQRHSLSEDEACLALVLPKNAINSMSSNPDYPISDSYAQIIRDRINQFENRSVNFIEALPAQKTVEATEVIAIESADEQDEDEDQGTWSCKDCSATFDSYRSLGGHRSRCLENKDNALNRNRAAKQDEERKKVVQFNGQPPTITVTLSNPKASDIIDYVKMDGKSNYVFSRNKDGSVTIYRE